MFPLQRRQFLQLGAMSALGHASSAASSPVSRANAKSCILVYLLGGPPHQDMWDLKPDAPAEVRGEFNPTATSVPGIQVCEHLPRMASQIDRLALVRSVSYPNHDHPYMTYYTLTGYVSPVPLGANTVLPPSRKDHPHMGSVVNRFTHRDGAVPGYVAIPDVRVRMKALPIAGGGRAGFLGPRFDPLAINEDPTKPLPNLQLPEDISTQRFRERKLLLAQLEGTPSRAQATREHSAFRESAARLLSDQSQNLFALEREPTKLRERYGLHRFGQSMLLARRMVESGVSFVGLHFNYMSKCDGWDTHKKNFPCLKDELLPMLDQSLSALIDDLAQRDRLNETLVVCMGEFGRTPKINKSGGRDHWGHCSSVVFAGGGIPGGTVVGSSDARGAYPNDHPIDPADVQATIYERLGLDSEHTMVDQLDRPLPISRGQPISALV